jgi:transcriptional regulator with XRE-family HTH domain
VEDEAADNRAEPVLGGRVRALREAREWSQETVAQRMAEAGFSWRQTTVAKTEAADRPIRVNEAVALADLFGVDLDSLVRPDLHPLVQRVQRERSILALAERELSEADRRLSEAQRLTEVGRGRVEALTELAGYVDAPSPERLPQVLGLLLRFFPDKEWQDVLVDAGWDRVAVEQAVETTESIPGNDPDEGRREGESWTDWEARLIAARFAQAGR